MIELKVFLLLFVIVSFGYLIFSFICEVFNYFFDSVFTYERFKRMKEYFIKD